MEDGEEVASPQVVVLMVKTNCACEGCGRKIKKHIKKFEGVLGVTVDQVSNRVRVLGNLNAEMLRDHVMKKFHEVEIVGTESPRNKVVTAAISSGRGGGFWSLFRTRPAATAALTHDLKELQLGASTEGCIKDAKKNLVEVNGVNEVHTDVEEEVPLQRKNKVGRNAEIVRMKTDSGSSNNGKGEKKKEERRSVGLKIYDGGEKKKEREGGGKEGMNMERVPGGVRIKEKKGDGDGSSREKKKVDGGGSSREKKKEKKGGGGGEKEEFRGGDWSGGFGDEKKKEEEEEVSDGYGCNRNGEEKEEERYGHGKKNEEAGTSGRMEWENNHNREEMDGGYDSHERREEGGSGRTHSSDGEEKENGGGGWN